MSGASSPTTGTPPTTWARPCWPARAGQAAESASALAGALGHYERALELWDQAPEAAAAHRLDRGTVLYRAAEAAYLAGDDARSPWPPGPRPRRHGRRPAAGRRAAGAAGPLPLATGDPRGDGRRRRAVAMIPGSRIRSWLGAGL